MSKIKYLLAGYLHKFRGERYKNQYRQEENQYLLINKSALHMDMGGWLETSRELHRFVECDTKKEALSYLKNEVAKSELKDWVMYKRYAVVPKEDS